MGGGGEGGGGINGGGGEGEGGGGGFGGGGEGGVGGLSKTGGGGEGGGGDGGLGEVGCDGEGGDDGGRQRLGHFALHSECIGSLSWNVRWQMLSQFHTSAGVAQLRAGSSSVMRRSIDSASNGRSSSSNRGAGLSM